VRLSFFTIFLAAGLIAAEAPRLPMPNDYSNSIKTRWLNKPVLERRLLDDAEDLGSWKLVNTEQARGSLDVAPDRAVSGSRSVRLTSPTTGDKPIPTTRYYGAAGAVRVVAGENWTEWNRLSVWIYPDLPGFRVVSLLIIFHNEGTERVPDVYGKMGLNYVILQNHRWNRIVWEIANLPRDRVTGIEFSYRVQGNEPGAADTVNFYIDKLELEKVNADHYLGWNVAPGEISFSHSGYQTGLPKSVLASDLEAREFEVINIATGLPVLRKAVTPVETRLGRFQLLDFSELREPGAYMISAGNRATRPFRIADDVWKASLWKAINFFFVERCGFAIEGVHEACHRDWTLVHGDRRIIVNGGWHDAGDLSQSFVNTAEAAYAMFSLAERLRLRGDEPELQVRLIEEARWGLDWILKTTFHDGYRPGFCTMDRWTNGILGDVDDMVCQASNNAGVNFAAAATEALASRVLRATDPVLAGYSLKQAIEDWGFALAGLEKQKQGVGTELAAHGALAALELFQTTRDRAYAEKAFELARILLNSQQRGILPGLKEAITGFFYTGPDRSQILRYSHASHEAAPVVALARLAELFPNHPEWMRWYSAVTLFAEYFQKSMARFSEPYGMLANSIYHDEDYKQAGRGRGATPEAFREQVLNGIKVGDHHYLRLFPVWFEFRGNHGTVLTQAKAVSTAAHLRSDFELAALAERQFQWVMGRNPFVQSTMWGEGYDYAPQYTAMSGDIVGSLPVGIQTRGNGDVPYWPAENCHNWKEVWVLPVARWIWLYGDLAGPALLTGRLAEGSAGAVKFREIKTGTVQEVAVDPATATFRALLPAGEYEATAGDVRRRIVLLPGALRHVDLRPDKSVEMRLEAQSNPEGTVTLRITAEGSGRHTLALKTDNLALAQNEQQINLSPGKPLTVTFQGRAQDPEIPWVTVVIPDGDHASRREVHGLARPPAAR